MFAIGGILGALGHPKWRNLAILGLLAAGFVGGQTCAVERLRVQVRDAAGTAIPEVELRLRGESSGAFATR